LFVCGFASPRRDITSARFASASVIVLPGLSRARRNNQRSPRRSRRFAPSGDGTVSCMPIGSASSDADTGIHSSGDSTGTMPLNRAGATPTIVYGFPRMRSVRPTAFGADPSSLTQ
jgi:hypothetical protein